MIQYYNFDANLKKCTLWFLAEEQTILFLIMLYNAKVEMINRKMLACALCCLKLLK